METNNGKKADSLGYMPHSLEDENYIISLMYHSIAKAEEVLAKLELGDIHNDFNRKVFRICQELTDVQIPVTSHTVVTELHRAYSGEWENIPFDLPTVWELEQKYQKIHQKVDKEGLAGAVKRLKADTGYREIIYRANDALLMARAREGSPEDIVAPLEELAVDIQRTKGSVIVWSDEAEREAQENYDKLDRGEIQAVPTGFPEVDAKLYGGGNYPGDLTIISGVTSGGKTTFGLNVADNGAELEYKSLYFTMEMKTFKVFSRIHSRKAKIPGYKIAPFMSQKYGAVIREKLRDTGLRMSKLPIGYIDSLRDMESIARVTRFAVREFGVQQIIIDYLGLAKPSKRWKGSTFDRASIVAEQAKEIAFVNNIPCLGLVQLRRKYKEEKGKGNDPEGNDIEPTLDMLKNSGDIENHADNVIFLWGEKGKEGEEDAIRHIHGRVAKARNGVLFPFELKFAPAIYNFSSMEQIAAMRSKLGGVTL